LEACSRAPLVSRGILDELAALSSRRSIAQNETHFVAEKQLYLHG
jgi:hypothetical protein